MFKVQHTQKEEGSMTLTRRLSGEITDIRSIDFVCKKCGAATSFNHVECYCAVTLHELSECADVERND